jgi:hypothetical protein
MCLFRKTQNPRANRLRRQGGIIAALSATLSSVNALSLLNGHPIGRAICIGVQAFLLTLAIGFFVRSTRLKDTP